MSNQSKLFTDALGRIEDRRAQLEAGNSTLLPFDKYLPRFSKILPGLIRGDQIIITANSGVGKSRFVRWLCKVLIRIAREEGMPMRIIYNTLEDHPDKVAASFVQSRLTNKYGMNLSYYELQHYASGGKQVSKKIFDNIKESYEFMDTELSRYLDVVQINNHYGIYKYVRDYLRKIGQFTLDGRPITYGKDDQLFDEYMYEDPATYVILINDTLDKCSNDKGMNWYDSTFYFTSRYCDITLGQKCGVICINVQQQASGKDEIKTNFKGNTIEQTLEPTADGLARCKITQQSATLIWGLFDPGRAFLPTHRGFDYHKLNPYYRSLQLIKGREAVPIDRVLRMFANLGIDEFEELPDTSDEQAMKIYHRKAKILLQKYLKNKDK